MALQTAPWDAAEYLNSPEMRAAYWDELLADYEKTRDKDFMQNGLTTLGRAMKMHGAIHTEEQTHKMREIKAIELAKTQPKAP